MSCDVSVIIPAYNSSGTLGRALDSVYGQSLPPREIIVVDDGSEDWEQSRQIAESRPGSIEVHFISLAKNHGPSSARNAGVSAAMGRYLAFLDADDIWYQDKLSIQYGLMTSRNLDFSMHRYRPDMTREGCGSEDGHDNSHLSISPLSSWTPLLRNDSTNSVMVRKQKMVLYDTSLRRGEDFALYMELLSKPGCRALYIRRALAGGFKGTLGVSGLSQDVKGMHLGRMLALKKLIHGGCIGAAQYLAGVCMETVKYPIRVLIVFLRRIPAPPGGDKATGCKACAQGNPLPEHREGSKRGVSERGLSEQ
jgi:glycosyltransferase involved in cell wall biosynthesis